VNLSKGQIAYTPTQTTTQSGTDHVNNSIMDVLNEKFGSNAEKYVAITQQLMQSPEIQAQKGKVNKADLDAKQIQDKIDQVEIDSRKLFGSETPEAVV